MREREGRKGGDGGRVRAGEGAARWNGHALTTKLIPVQVGRVPSDT